MTKRIFFLRPATVTVLTERRRLHPAGSVGGDPGAAGENTLDHAGTVVHLAGKGSFDIQAGDVLTIQTPGGGGHGQST